MTLIVKGISQKGKNRVREHGDRWIVMDIVDKVIFDSKEGPWYLVTPEKININEARWVHEKTDIDFHIISMEGTWTETSSGTLKS